MFSLNLPTTQDYVHCWTFGFFKVANEIENAGQSMLSGTQSWDQSLVCSERYIRQQDIRQPVEDKEAPYTHVSEESFHIEIGFFPLVDELKGKQRLS